MLSRTNTKLAAGAILIALISAMYAIQPADAHLPTLEADCETGWSYQLQFYNASGTNTVSVWVDDILIVDEMEFGVETSDSGPWPSIAETHTLRLEVDAWDDPSGSEGYSIDETGSCVSITTTTSSTIPEDTTTTTEQVTTTTSIDTTTTSLDTTTTSSDTTTTSSEPSTTTTNGNSGDTTTSTVPCEGGLVLDVQGNCILPVTGGNSALGIIAIVGAIMSVIGLGMVSLASAKMQHT